MTGDTAGTDVSRTDAAVRTVVTRLRLPAGESLARRLLAAERGVAERHRTLAAVRVVRRRLGHDVPPLLDAAGDARRDPRDVAAAERTLSASLSPPADEDELHRLDAAVRTARERLDAATDESDAGRTATGDSVAEGA